MKKKPAFVLTGVLLTALTQETGDWDVAYVGVVPQARRLFGPEDPGRHDPRRRPGR